jgi:endonuclease/exonuclease/phosphatase family metal-dependent hydrolase
MQRLIGKHIWVALLLTLAATTNGCVENEDGTLSLADEPNGAIVPIVLPYKALTVNVKRAYGGLPEKYEFHNRLDRIVNMFEVQQPDVVGLQEIYTGYGSPLYYAAEEVTGINYWYYWVQRHSHDPSPEEWVGLWVNFDRFSILDYGHGHATYDHGIDNWDRPIQWVKVEERSTGKKKFFVNTHFPKEYDHDKVKHAEFIMDLIETLGADHTGVVVLGDFNSGYQQDGTKTTGFEEMWLHGYRSAYDATHVMNEDNYFATSNPDWDESLRQGKMIDHVLVYPATNTSSVFSSGIDHTMSTYYGGSYIDCTTVVPIADMCFDSDGVFSGMLEDYYLYSDHFATWARLWM